jgi:hypothetical protein
VINVLFDVDYFYTCLLFAQLDRLFAEKREALHAYPNLSEHLYRTSTYCTTCTIGGRLKEAMKFVSYLTVLPQPQGT